MCLSVYLNGPKNSSSIATIARGVLTPSSAIPSFVPSGEPTGVSLGAHQHANEEARRLRVRRGSARRPVEPAPGNAGEGSHQGEVAVVVFLPPPRRELLMKSHMIAKPESIGPHSTDQLPNSQRVYVPGTLHPDVRVPMRQIALAPTKSFNGQTAVNEPVRVYDTSGPWGDPSFSGTVQQG